MIDERNDGIGSQCLYRKLNDVCKRGCVCVFFCEIGGVQVISLSCGVGDVWERLCVCVCVCGCTRVYLFACVCSTSCGGLCAFLCVLGFGSFVILNPLF